MLYLHIRLLGLGSSLVPSPRWKYYSYQVHHCSISALIHIFCSSFFSLYFRNVIDLMFEVDIPDVYFFIRSEVNGYMTNKWK